MISEKLHSQLVYWISQVVYWQLGVVALISLGTFFLLVYRQWRHRQKTYWTQIFADQLVEELISSMEGQKKSHLPHLQTYQFIKVESLKTVLLGQISSISGAEKDYITERYFELGMVKTDLALCASLLWWKRLEGISNLRVLSSDKMASIFRLLKSDPHEIVSTTAKLGLSELNHKLNTIDVKELVPLIHYGRESSLVQVAMSWCEVHGFEAVFNPFRTYPNPKIRESLMIALTNVKTAESSALFGEFLKDADFESPQLLSRIIRALREAGDPEALPIIVNFVHHPDERVQGQAMEYVLEFLPEERYGELRIIELDPSPFVQRVLKSWHLKKVA